MFEFLTLGKNTKESQWTEISRFFIEETMYFCMMNFLPLRCGFNGPKRTLTTVFRSILLDIVGNQWLNKIHFGGQVARHLFLEFGMMVATTNVFVWWNKNGLEWHIYISLAIIRMEFSSNKPPLVIFFRFLTMTDHDTKNASLMARKELRIWKLRGWKK